MILGILLRITDFCFQKPHWCSYLQSPPNILNFKDSSMHISVEPNELVIFILTEESFVSFLYFYIWSKTMWNRCVNYWENWMVAIINILWTPSNHA